MSWAFSNASMLAHLTGQNAYLALVPVLIGLAVSLPLGVACVRFGWLYPPVLGLISVLYALPGLALFVVLIAYTGLTDTTVMIPLGVYSLAAIFPSVVDGLKSVPEPVRQAAVAMGFGTWRRLITVELPISVPVIIAGLRVATVSSISLVSVGGLIGIGGLGYLFIDGEQRDFSTEIIVGIVLIVVLALVADSVLVAARRVLTPWQRGTARAERSTFAKGELRGQPGTGGATLS
ncbi:MAG: ABC transporter permease [Streptosporangiaceae bacterium]